MRGLEKANLVLVLLVAQAVQVLLLALAVFGFFLVFGAVAIHDDVVTSWIGVEPEDFLGSRCRPPRLKSRRRPCARKPNRSCARPARSHPLGGFRGQSRVRSVP